MANHFGDQEHVFDNRKIRIAAAPTSINLGLISAPSGGGGEGGTNATEIMVAASDETTDLTTGLAKVTFRMPHAMTLTGVRANVNTAPTDATINVDINQNGTSILSTVITIDATEKTSTTAAAQAVISTASLTDDAEITIDIDQVGSTIAGKGLKVALIGVRA